MHVDTDSPKLKADQRFGGYSQEWVWLVWSWEPGHGTLKLTVSQNWADGINWFFHSGTNSGKLKVDSVIYGWALSKMAVAF